MVTQNKAAEYMAFVQSVDSSIAGLRMGISTLSTLTKATKNISHDSLPGFFGGIAALDNILQGMQDELEKEKLGAFNHGGSSFGYGGQPNGMSTFRTPIRITNPNPGYPSQRQSMAISPEAPAFIPKGPADPTPYTQNINKAQAAIADILAQAKQHREVQQDSGMTQLLRNAGIPVPSQTTPTKAPPYFRQPTSSTIRMEAPPSASADIKMGTPRSTPKMTPAVMPESAPRKIIKDIEPTYAPLLLYLKELDEKYGNKGTTTTFEHDWLKVAAEIQARHSGRFWGVGDVYVLGEDAAKAGIVKMGQDVKGQGWIKAAEGFY